VSPEYGSHVTYVEWVKKDADDRQLCIEKALREAFSTHLEKREVDVIIFSGIDVFQLADAISKQPLILKPLLATCNIAARAIERDLSIKNLNTYLPRLTPEKANAVAGYMKPFLPDYLELSSLAQIDRMCFIDKEIRKGKGRWEKKILMGIIHFSGLDYKKRKFISVGEQYELDAAYPISGDIEIGIDIKRIEARRDIHKRCDEIVNKAYKFKSAFPKAKFGAVIYYPFIQEHINIQNRLRSDNIDNVVFAAESDESINTAVGMLVAGMGAKKDER
jgi:hypothetical protein